MAPSFSPKATPPRSATSRLLAMKFMNRLGPSDSSPAATSPSTPLSQSMSAGVPDDDAGGSTGKRGHDNDDDQPSSKRRRVSAGFASRAPSANGTPTSAHGATMAEMQGAMQASIEEEERRRQAAIKKRAAELGDEQWTWGASLPPHIAAKLAAHSGDTPSATVLPYSVVRVGFAEIDSRMAADDGTKPRIMRFNMKASGKNGDSTADSDDGADKSTRAALGGTRKRSRSEAGSQRKDAPPKLKNLTSLSSQGGQNVIKCHSCGRNGHKASSCPSSNPKRSGSKSKKR